MLLPKFDYHAPATAAEACDILAEYGDKARVIAGGTDLMVNMKKGAVCPTAVVSIADINDLKEMAGENGHVRIGACVTVAELAESDLIAGKLSALRAGARALGTPLVRNRATIGGNVGSARPAADLPPSLMVYGAEVLVTNKKGERTEPIGEFFKGPGMTIMAADDLITGFRVPVPPPSAGAGYINIGIRKAQDCNLVNVCSYLELAGDDTIKTARIVLGCVGPTHLRAPSAEKALIGEKPGDALFERVGEAAMGDCTPILDFRGSAEYRRAMVGVLTRRTLAKALKEARDRA